ncbi:MAG: LysM peptidoglycan-binding domain-containing protein [Blastochloris sp.]|nr:LysM peptidoglycan-binding domain-containing protein [Blastochloris sp.]
MTAVPSVAEPDVDLEQSTVIVGVDVQETLVPELAPEIAPESTEVADPTTVSTVIPDAATAVPPTEEPTPEPEEEPTATPTAVPDEPETPDGDQLYVVESGDTLSGIAEQFDVSVVDIIDANGLTPDEADSLQIGQELIIP